MSDEEKRQWFAWEANRALDRNDLAAHEHWGRLYHGVGRAAR